MLVLGTCDPRNSSDMVGDVGCDVSSQAVPHKVEVLHSSAGRCHELLHKPRIENWCVTTI